VEGHDTDEGAYTLDVEFIPDSPDYVIAFPISSDPLLKNIPNPADRNFTLGLDASGSISEMQRLRFIMLLAR
jgi:hypothetical protein